MSRPGGRGSCDLGHSGMAIGSKVSSEPAYVHVDWQGAPDLPLGEPKNQDLFGPLEIFDAFDTSVSPSVLHKDNPQKEQPLQEAIAMYGPPPIAGPHFTSSTGTPLPLGKTYTSPVEGGRNKRETIAKPQAKPRVPGLVPHPNSGKGQPNKKLQPFPKRHTIVKIASHLNELEQDDPNKILIVRKINRLGFDSADILISYFEHVGPVAKVRLSSPHEKHGFNVRLRPSGIGFVVFENADDAARAVALGDTQTIAGAEIIVKAFQRRQDRSIDEDQVLDDE